ncbi:MAG: TolC family protein [Acidobacteria bacterium]|nr:TolC family protein [Acidobacteriota bacterium]
MKIEREDHASIRVWLLLFLLAVQVSFAEAQPQIAENRETVKNSVLEHGSETGVKENTESLLPSFNTASVLPKYFDQDEGLSLEEILDRAFKNNGSIKIALLEVERSKARFRQAGLRQNPTLEVAQSSGKLVGSGGDHTLNVGFSIPLDIYDRRSKRIELAEAEITLKEAEIDARKRELSGQVVAVYSDALATLQELKMIEDLLDLDTKTVRFVQIRVNEGETSPLELSLLQTEVERLRARQSLVEGRLQSAISRLKFHSGLSYDKPLKLREQISAAAFPGLPDTIETAFALALKNRPEIRLAELEEALATAGLRLINTNSKPEVSAYTRYSQGRSEVDDPRGSFAERDRSLTFGVSIGLPAFNKNQGAKAEAEIAIRQAQEKKIFAEQIIKNEVATAFTRIEATNLAYLRLETAVLPRSRKNVETIRSVYEIGELKITDLINEQRRLLDANRDLTEVMSERYRANADLFNALGIGF